MTKSELHGLLGERLEEARSARNLSLSALTAAAGDDPAGSPSAESPSAESPSAESPSVESGRGAERTLAGLIRRSSRRVRAAALTRLGATLRQAQGAITGTPGATTRTPGATAETPGATTRTPGATTETPGATTETPGATAGRGLRLLDSDVVDGVDTRVYLLRLAAGAEQAPWPGGVEHLLVTAGRLGIGGTELTVGQSHTSAARAHAYRALDDRPAAAILVRANG